MIDYVAVLSFLLYYSNYFVANMKSKSQDHWIRKCKNRFSRMSSWKVDRFSQTKTSIIDPFYIYRL